MPPSDEDFTPPPRRDHTQRYVKVVKRFGSTKLVSAKKKPSEADRLKVYKKIAQDAMDRLARKCTRPRNPSQYILLKKNMIELGEKVRMLGLAIAPDGEPIAAGDGSTVHGFDVSVDRVRKYIPSVIESMIAEQVVTYEKALANPSTATQADDVAKGEGALWDKAKDRFGSLDRPNSTYVFLEGNPELQEYGKRQWKKYLAADGLANDTDSNSDLVVMLAETQENFKQGAVNTVAASAIKEAIKSLAEGDQDKAMVLNEIVFSSWSQLMPALTYSALKGCSHDMAPLTILDVKRGLINMSEVITAVVEETKRISTSIGLSKETFATLAIALENGSAEEVNVYVRDLTEVIKKFNPPKHSS